jgi:hypothetical protein
MISGGEIMEKWRIPDEKAMSEKFLCSELRMW